MSDMSPQQVIQMNAQMRAMLLSTAPEFEKNLGTFTELVVGRSTRIKLANVGIITKLVIDVTAQVAITVAVATPSTKAPWNLINRIRVSDYDGSDRVNMSGFQLFILACRRRKMYYGFNNDVATATFVNPKIPTAIATDNIQFLLEIPLAFDVDNSIVQLRDLRGAVLAQTATGEMYLTIDWNPSLYANGDVDSVYSAGGSTIALAANGIQCTVYQHYLLPQAIGPNGQLPLPQVDLMTVYELIGNIRSSDNLAVNSEKLLNYPNVRSVIGFYINYVQNGTLQAAKINLFKLVANANNILKERTERKMLLEMRMLLNGDLIAGSYFMDHTAKPIETALFGNVQLSLTPNTVGGANYVEFGYESFYTKGMALPGTNQGS